MKIKFEDLGSKEYKETWEYQESFFNKLLETKKDKTLKAEQRLLFVEHPHVYTLWKSGSDNNLLLNYIQLQAKNATFFHTNRGGDITYHGPGQIVGYPIFDLEQFYLGLKQYITKLEEAIILTLKHYGIEGSIMDGATGVWLDVDKPAISRKICAIGVKSSRYITMHGFALNVNTDLTYFDHINPCGFTDKGVTSIQKELGKEIDFEEAKSITLQNLQKVFGFES